MSISATTQPSEAWTCTELMIWHQRLQEAYGLQSANETFMVFYESLGAFHAAKNSCRYDNNFINYFLNKGLDLRSWWSAIFTNTTDVVVGATDNINQSVDNTGNTLNKVTQTLSWALPVGIVVVLGGTIWYLNNIAENIEEKTE